MTTTTTPDVVRRVEYVLEGGPPWGLRLAKHHAHNNQQQDSSQPQQQQQQQQQHLTKVARVHPFGLAWGAGLRDGDLIETVNGDSDALRRVVSSCSDKLVIVVRRSVAVQQQHCEASSAAVAASSAAAVESSAAAQTVSTVMLRAESYSHLDSPHGNNNNNHIATTREMIKFVRRSLRRKNTKRESYTLKHEDEQQSGQEEEVVSTTGRSLIKRGELDQPETTPVIKCAATPPCALLIADPVVKGTDAVARETDLLSESVSSCDDDVRESPSLVREVLSTLQLSTEEGDAVAAEISPVPIWVPPSQEPSPAPKRKFKHVNAPGQTGSAATGAAQEDSSYSSPGGSSSSNNGAGSTTGGLLQLVEESSSLPAPPPAAAPPAASSTVVSLPRFVSPTVTLLKKAREGSLPRGASYLPSEESSSVSVKSIVVSQQQQSSPVVQQRSIAVRPSSIIPPQLQRTKEVVPREEQHEWYKQMYDAIHVEKSSSNSNRVLTTPTLVDNKSPTLGGIKFSPGRIEDYNPISVGSVGSSSSVDKKKKKRIIPPELKRHWALEEDTQIISKSPDPGSEQQPRPLTPSEQRQLYVEIQKGGDVPIHGLRMVNKENPTPPSTNGAPVTSSGSKRTSSPGGTAGKSLQLTRSSSSSLIPRYSSSRVMSPVRTIEEIKIQLDSSVGSSSSRANKKKKQVVQQQQQQPIKPQRGNKKKANVVVVKSVRLNDEPVPETSIPVPPVTQTLVKPTKTSILRELTTSLQKIPQQPPTTTVAAAATGGKIRRSLSQQTLRDYAEYIISLRHSSGKSARFRRLHSLYSSLERLNNLSRSAQETYTLTKLSAAKSLDFNDWWRWRNRIRIDKEIGDILQELLQAQEDKEFFFSSSSCYRDIIINREFVPDSHLRFKKFNVREIQEILMKPVVVAREQQKDSYRSMFRGTSVRESCLNLEVLNEVMQKQVKRSNTFCCGNFGSSSSGGGSKVVVVTRPRGFTLSSDRYDPVSSKGQQSLRSAAFAEDEERRRKLFSGLICEELKLRGVVRKSSSPGGLVLSRRPPLYGLYSFDVKERTRRLQELSSGGGGGGQQKKNLVEVKGRRRNNNNRSSSSSPVRDNIILQEKKRNLLQQQQQSSVKHPQHQLQHQFHSVETRSRRPLYQPSGAPNVLQPMLFHQQQQSSPGGGGHVRTTTVRLLDSRVFVNFDPALHQPKFRYTPSRDVTANSSSSRVGGGRRTMVHIHYASPVILEEKEFVAEETLRRTQQLQMQRFYEEQRKAKQVKEIQDQHARRHHHHFVPSQKSPIPLNRYDEDDDDEGDGGDEEDFYDFRGGSSPSSGNKQALQGGAAAAASVGFPFMARALYDFKAMSNRELCLTKGEVVTVLRRLDANWFEGEASSRRINRIGIFPTTYVTALASSSPPITTAPPLNKSFTPPKKTALVQFDFRPAGNTLELPLAKGERVTVLRSVDANWLEGRIGRKRGIFPASYVTIEEQNKKQHSYTPNAFQLQQLQQLQEESLEDYSSSAGDDNRRRGRGRREKRFRCLYGYVPLHEDELELAEGDVVEVMEMCDDGWFVGTNLRSNKFGTFPGNYVDYARD